MRTLMGAVFRRVRRRIGPVYIRCMNRRDFLKTTTAGALMAGGTMRALGAVDLDMESEILNYKKPVFNLHSFFNAPVKIESIELLEAYGRYFCARARRTERKG